MIVEAANWVIIICVIAVVSFLFLGLSVMKDQRDVLREEKADLEEALAAKQRKIATLTSSGAELVPKVGWRKKKLMNKPEFYLFRELENLIGRSSSGHRLFTQVSCGEFLEVAYRHDLKETAEDAFHCLNRKRVDFLIIDRFGVPVLAIEYHGSGHYQGSVHDRDHTKRVACFAAGIQFLEVPETGLTAGQRRDLHDLLGTISRVAAE